MKAQVWSADVLLAIIIFSIILVGFFYITGLTAQSEKTKAMASQAEKIHESLTTSSNKTSIAFIEGNKIDMKKLEMFANMSYQQIKNYLGVSGGDFCIHLEDESGDIIYISGNRSGIGSEQVIIGNKPCNQTR